MKHLLGMCLLAAAALGLGACQVVITNELLGPIDPNIGKSEFEGAWALDQKSDPPIVVNCHFSSDSKTLVCAGLEWKGDKDRFEKRQIRCLITRVGERRFLNIDNRESDDPLPGYGLCEFTITDTGHIVLWPMVYDAFEAAILNKELAGTKKEDKDYVTITDTSENLARVVVKEAKREYFDTRKPIVLRRLGQ